MFKKYRKWCKIETLEGEKMKNKRKIWTLVVVVLLIVAVGYYFLIGRQGKTEIITYDELQEKINNKEDFVYMMMMTGCPACEGSEEMLQDYFRDHNFTMYMFNLTDFPSETEEEKANRDAYFENYRTVTESEGVYTPTFFVYEKGEIKDFHIGSFKTVDELDEFVVKHQLEK